MIRTLIIEDEIPASKRLTRILQEVDPSFEVIGQVDSIQTAVEWFRCNPDPDLIMLDIQLADGLSFEIFSSVETEAFVIFTTAYDDYAIRAFELNSIDYLQKPIDKSKLDKSLQKFKRLSEAGRISDLKTVMDIMSRREKVYKQRFSVYLGDGIKLIDSKDAALFYTMEKNCFLCTFDSRNYGINYTLEKLEEVLDPTLFFRISRQHIINFHIIEKLLLLSKSRISISHSLKDVEKLMVSTARTAQFREWIER